MKEATDNSSFTHLGGVQETFRNKDTTCQQLGPAAAEFTKIVDSSREHGRVSRSGVQLALCNGNSKDVTNGSASVKQTASCIP
jgi:hypothetical protein